MNKKKNILVKLSPIITFAVLFGALELACHIFEIPRYMFTPPSESFEYLFTKFDEMWPHISKTLWQYFTGYFIGVVVGVGLAFLLSLNEWVSNATWPYLIMLVSTPQLILVPILKMVMGFGPEVAILTTVLSTFLINTTMTAAGIQTVPVELKELVTSCKGTRFQQFVKVTIPASLPSIFTGLKLGAIFALAGICGAEISGDSSGIGYQIRVLTSIKSYPAMFAYVYVLIIFGVCFYLLLDYIEKKVVKK